MMAAHAWLPMTTLSVCAFKKQTLKHVSNSPRVIIVPASATFCPDTHADEHKMNRHEGGVARSQENNGGKEPNVNKREETEPLKFHSSYYNKV